jgi:hypothetical protein
MQTFRKICILLFLCCIIPSIICHTGEYKHKSNFSYGKFRAEEPGDVVTLDFTNTGDYTVYVNGALVDTGIFSIQGNKIILETSIYCKSYKIEKATYIWTLENGTLSFQVIGEDKCGPRYDDFQYSYKRIE